MQIILEKQEYDEMVSRRELDMACERCENQKKELDVLWRLIRALPDEHYSFVRKEMDKYREAPKA